MLLPPGRDGIRNNNVFPSDLGRNLIPLSIRQAHGDWIARNRLKAFAKLTQGEVFRRIYADGLWGSVSDPNERFFSGPGTHDANFVATYCDAVEKFALARPEKLVAVDLGCGDFTVGSRIRPLFSKYIACDVVGPLIQRNEERFATLDVDFRVLDVTADPLPPADVVILRQVLQHLSNQQIQATIAKIPAAYAV